MATSEALAAGTAAATSDAIPLSGPTVFLVNTGSLADGEKFIIWGEDAAENYTEKIYEFEHRNAPSVLIEEYRSVKVEKTITSASLGARYGA